MSMLSRCLSLAQSGSSVDPDSGLMIVLVVAFVIALVVGSAFLRALAALAEIARLVAGALFAGLGALAGVGALIVLLVLWFVMTG